MCNSCGKIGDHSEQVELFPVGQTVVAISEFQEINGVVPVGCVGTVSEHCRDGRAVIDFVGHGTHTFHFTDGYIAKANASRAKVQK